MKLRRNGRAWESAALFVALLLGCCVPMRAQNSAAPESAICPIVYQVDEGVPSPHGYRYLFFGNGFFINKDGYVLTAAHVLGQLQGGQPYLLLHDNAGQVEFVKADVAAIDSDHDIAVLRAETSPFDGKHAVSFLPLDARDAQAGEMLRASSFMPSNARDAFSLDPIREEQSPGKVLRFEFSQLDKGAAQTELFLFNHDIHPGQSGSPVISDESHGVAGLVEGQWLRDNSAVLAELSVRKTGDGPPLATGIASVPGAVVPIHYALPLLQQKGIAWQAASRSSDAHGDKTGNSATESNSFDGPEPLSLVAAPYPVSLFGGEVLLDAAVNRDGTLSDVKVVSGEQPFLKQALDAARTWTFVPRLGDEHAGQTRIAIAFQFPQPYAPPRRPTVQHFERDSSGSARNRSTDPGTGDASAFVLTSYEPDYPVASNADGSVILYESIDRDGHLTNTRALAGAEPLRSAALAAANEWQFAPAKRSGSAVDSAAIVVVTFRQPLSGVPAAPRCAMKMCGEKACVVCDQTENATQKKN
ncbi:MAG TPA: energy transducer TonB [Candidatus Acidoferrales bacterium]